MDGYPRGFPTFSGKRTQLSSDQPEAALKADWKRSFRGGSRRNVRRRGVRAHRAARVETLEPRYLLSGNTPPTLAPIDDVVLYGGAPLHVALDGYDADGDALTYEITIDDPSLVQGTVPSGNRSLKIVVENFGAMTFELFEDLVPNTTSRIIELAQDDFYDGLTFHRIIDNFMIQGGDPNGDGTGGSGTTFDDEFQAALQHTSAGVLSMAKSSDDTNDSQFFITDTATRHLDFNHTVFGFLTEGDSVREAIQGVPTDANDKPLAPVTISDMVVFDDVENGVLRLSAAEGASGTAHVTVTVRDGNGGEASQSFTVNVQPDPIDNYPYLLAVDPIHLANGGSAGFSVPATDVDGGAMVYYAAAQGADADKFTVDFDSTTGEGTISVEPGAYGVASMLVAVRAETPANYFSGRDVWDSQLVPVLVDPPAPSAVELVSSSDTGLSDSDRLTNKNNTPGNTLSFRVYGVIPGAEVILYADGVEIGRTAAAVDTPVVVTEGDVTQTDGTHEITARQILHDVSVDVGNLHDTATLSSGLSGPLEITVDTQAPSFSTSAPVDAAVGREYEYDANSPEETAGAARYRLTQSPAGMLIDAATGLVRWTPGDTQTGDVPVSIELSDAAGNTTVQSFTIAVTEGPKLLNVPGAPVVVTEGDLVQIDFDVEAPPQRAPFVFAFDGPVPEGAAIDASTGVFTWQTDEADGPSYSTIRVRVTDAIGASTVESFSVLVTELNTIPRLDPINDVVLQEGDLLDLTLHAEDDDLPADTLYYSLSGTSVPQDMAVSLTGGRIVWQTDEADGGKEFDVSVRVRDRLDPNDPTGKSTWRTFHVSVIERDDAPVFATAAEPRLVFPGETLSFPVSAVDPDIPANDVVVSAVELPPGATFDPASGMFTWAVPAEADGGSFQAVFQAIEQSTAAASAMLQVPITVVDPRALLAPQRAATGGETAVEQEQGFVPAFLAGDEAGSFQPQFDVILPTVGGQGGVIRFTGGRFSGTSRVGSSGVQPGRAIDNGRPSDEASDKRGRANVDQPNTNRGNPTREDSQKQSGDIDPALRRALAELLSDGEIERIIAEATGEASTNDDGQSATAEDARPAGPIES